MSKCLQCGTEIKQTEGRRQRKFCDNKGKCRYQYFLANKPKEQKYVLKSTHDKVIAKYENIISNINPNAGDTQAANKALHEGVLEYANGLKEGETVSKEFIKLAKENNEPTPIYENDAIRNEIKAIRAEKIPEHRNTTIGRKSWKADQEKRIKELAQKLPS